MTHFVIPWISNPKLWHNHELLYAIRSIQKNFVGEKKIFVVGDPIKIKNVTSIPCPRIKGMRYAKAFDAANKLMLICNSPEINDNFIYTYDDTIILRKATEKPFKVVIARNYPKKINEYFKDRQQKQDDKWYNTFIKTYRVLKKEGLPVWDYETHIPRMFNKKRVKTILDKYKLQKNVMLFATLYFNNFYVGPTTTLTETPNIKAEFYHAYPPERIDELTKGRLFLNYNDNGLSNDLQKWIRARF